MVPETPHEQPSRSCLFYIIYLAKDPSQLLTNAVFSNICGTDHGGAKFYTLTTSRYERTTPPPRNAVPRRDQHKQLVCWWYCRFDCTTSRPFVRYQAWQANSSCLWRLPITARPRCQSQSGLETATGLRFLNGTGFPSPESQPKPNLLRLDMLTPISMCLHPQLLAVVE